MASTDKTPHLAELQDEERRRAYLRRQGLTAIQADWQARNERLERAEAEVVRLRQIEKAAQDVVTDFSLSNAPDLLPLSIRKLGEALRG